MEIAIQPEPTPDQRAAIESALAQLLDESELPAAYRSAWRSVGIAENVEAEAD